MSFDLNFQLVSLIPSAIGFVLFVYGKKQQHWTFMIGGAVLAIYPYLIESTTALIVWGIVICAAIWAAARAGW